MTELSWRVLARFITREGRAAAHQLKEGLNGLELTDEFIERLQVILPGLSDSEGKVLDSMQVSLFVPSACTVGDHSGTWGFFYLVRRRAEAIVAVDVYLYPELLTP